MNWFRVYHGLCTDPKLHKAARIAGCRRSVAIAAWLAVLESASAAHERGHANGLDADTLAYLIDEPLQRSERLLAAFDQLGMLVDGTVTAWCKRQFDSDSSTERVREFRERNADRFNMDKNSSSGQNHNLLETLETNARGNVSETHQNQSQNQSQKDKKERKNLPPPLGDSDSREARPDGLEDEDRGRAEIISKLGEGSRLGQDKIAEMVGAMVEVRGSWPAVRLAILDALNRGTRNPLAYARKCVEDWDAKRAAAIVPEEDCSDETIMRKSLALLAKGREDEEKLRRACAEATDEATGLNGAACEAISGSYRHAEQSLH